MEEIAAHANTALTPVESVFISYASAARHLAHKIKSALDNQGIRYIQDEKQHDPGDILNPATQAAIQDSDYYFLACTTKCPEHKWLKYETTYAITQKKRPLLFLENLNIRLPWIIAPGLITDNQSRVAGYFARSAPDNMAVERFIDELIDTSGWKTKHFQCARHGRKRIWQLAEDSVKSQTTDTFEALSLYEPSDSVVKGLVEISFDEEATTGLIELGYGMFAGCVTERYTAHYEAKLRGVIVRPRKLNTLAIGMRIYDFDSGAENLRAGTPSVDDQLYGRDIYGWHMSREFWKASLKKMQRILSTN
ncbi:MAG: toll/interleukin-1 receptor domain-containing protein [Gammaproteobacteria bacterium]|nr:toll/interleukin-1 receptor domain-containing protein [Gammaproteobacteria bacterium]